MNNYEKEYDFVYTSTYPAFYKTLLFNELVRQGKKVLAIYYKEDNRGQRGKDFFTYTPLFQTITLNGNSLSKLFQLFRLVHSFKIRQLIIGGWSPFLSYILAFLSPRQRNACIVESSLYESPTHGIRAWLKRFYLHRICTVFSAGSSGKKLVQKLGFKGAIKQMYGCGILNYIPQPKFQERDAVKKFLCVSRLIEEKNLSLLISVFNNQPQLQLTIIGKGPLKEQLQAMANSNIEFKDYVPNDQISQFYQDADVFILPSKSETWGLVVEEALNNGTPVIVSDRVGCREDLVTENTGLVFTFDNKKSLSEAIEKITQTDFYNHLREQISYLDFIKKSQQLVQLFLEQL